MTEFLPPTVTRLLHVDSDPSSIVDVDDCLRMSGFDVIHASTLSDARQLLPSRCFDCAVIDIALTDGDGADLIREFRAHAELRTMPLLVLSARNGLADRVIGFELGADAYLGKPVEPVELRACMKSLLRRRAPDAVPCDVLRFGRLEIDLASRVVRLAGEMRAFTSHQFEVLVQLALRAGRVMSRNQLSWAVRGRGSESDDRSIDVHVARIRQLIEDEPSDPRRLLTVRGGGYVFARLQDCV